MLYVLFFLKMQVFSQATVQTYVFSTERAKVDAPLIQLKDSVIADKINHKIWSEFLRTTPPKNTYEKKPELDIYEGSYSIRFKVVRNTSHLLTLWLQYTSCGGSCSGYSEFHTFDLSNGKHVHPEQIFTPKGCKEISDKIGPNVVPSGFQGHWDAYCKIPYKQIIYEKKYLQFELLDGAYNPMDSLRIPIDSSSGYFSEYGKKMVFGAQNKAVVPYVYDGAIDKYKITAIIKFYADKLDGLYYYSKWGTPIPVTGKVLQDSIIIYANDGKEVFKGLKTHSTISGTWSLQKKSLPFTLTEVDLK